MTKPTSKHVKHALAQGNKGFQDIIAKVQHLKALDKMLKQCLDDQLAAHCRVANLNKGSLVIEADSGAWATQLRYLSPEILSFMRSTGRQYSLRSIRTYIHPKALEREKKTEKQHAISKTSGDLIGETAGKINHPALKEALEKLAKN